MVLYCAIAHVSAARSMPGKYEASFEAISSAGVCRTHSFASENAFAKTRQASLSINSREAQRVLKALAGMDAPTEIDEYSINSGTGAWRWTKSPLPAQNAAAISDGEPALTASIFVQSTPLW